MELTYRSQLHPPGAAWQAPLNGSNSASQYLYCTSGTHQLTGLYITGSTCANKTNPVYQGSDDAWGNVTSRTTQGSTATLSYDKLDRLVECNNSGANTQEWYVYDAAGNRVLRRSTSGGNTSITTYAFGSVEHLYSGTGASQGSTYYYSLGGMLIGELLSVTGSTNFFMTDGLGSVMATFSNLANSAVVQGNQVYDPYGTQRYNKGSMGTNKGFTGQYNDVVTGLDYYNARYYDPVVGVFLSADKTQGDLQGVNPYAYVGGNPETKNDPTGKRIVDMSGDWAQRTSDGGVSFYTVGYAGGKYDSYTHAELLGPTYDPMTDPNNHSFFTMFQQVFDGVSAAWNHAYAVLSLPSDTPTLCGALSFTPATKVATSQGAKAIGSLHPGQSVWAYNSKTHNMELQPIVHVWINHDRDLVDVTITSSTLAHHGAAARQTSEVVHTNQKHPFLTVEKGFIPVSQLHVGMHVINANGGVGMITRLKVVAGAMIMYNLEIAQDHTFTVGDGKWIVHNCGGVPDDTFDNSFKGLDGASYQQIMARIPQNATVKPWSPNPKGAFFGSQWTWKDGPYMYTLRMHSIDRNAVDNYPGSNAAQGWVFRLIRSGNSEGTYLMDRNGKWHPQQETNKDNVPGSGRMVSPKGEYDPNVANDTHIPMEDPWDTYFNDLLGLP